MNKQHLTQRSFLFLQGPISPFFTLVANELEKRGHGVHAIHFNIGDRWLWRRAGGVSFRKKIDAWQRFIGDFLDQHRITDVVLLGEQREYHRIAIEAAKTRGCRVTVTDFGYLRPDWITLEQDGMSGCSVFPRDPEAIRALARQAPPFKKHRVYEDNFWKMARWEMLYYLGNYFFWWTYPHYVNHKLENPILEYVGTGLRLFGARFKGAGLENLLGKLSKGGKPYFLFPLQMAHDFQLRAYSPFADQDEAIELVISSFAKHAPKEALLLIKVHPWDNGLRRWQPRIRRCAKAHGVADRIQYVDGGSLDRMVRRAQGMVIINSTSGLQAVRSGCPLITLGQAIFNVPGLTWQGGLDSFWTDAKPPDSLFVEDYLRAMAGTIQIRGVFYAQPGLDAAVRQAVERLHTARINTILPAIKNSRINALSSAPALGGELS